MTYSALPRIVLAASIVLCATSITNARYANAEDSAGQQADVLEGLSSDQIHDIYKARALGMKLYGEEKYDEAYPPLMTAATHGLKRAQAQLGIMHLRGLGGAKKDTRYAIGWLGVAADGKSEPAIKKYFEEIWEKIPSENVPAYEKLVDQFVANYGTDANDVNCRRTRNPGSKIRSMRCMITDEDGRVVTDMIDEVTRGLSGSGIDSIGGAFSAGPAGP